MGWMLVAALCIMWAAFLLPNRKGSSSRSVEEFGRNMDLLADTEGQGRWIVTPRKGMAFVGTRERAKQRARERRRKVFTFLLESLALTFLIGLVPPLRVMWAATGALALVLAAYTWLLVSIRARAQAAHAPMPARPTRERSATDAAGRTPRPAFNGLPSLGADDLANVVVRPTQRVGVAGV